MNVPETHDGAQVVITTAAYRAGQAAAWRDYEKDPDTEPNRALLARLKSEEFAAGYCDEFNLFIFPARALKAQREASLPRCGGCGEVAHGGPCWFD